MTIDEQLRDMARRADERQRPITVEEILARASGGVSADFTPPRRTAIRRRRQWFIAAAAVILVVAGVGFLAIDTDHERDSLRTVTDAPTTTVPVISNGSIAFAADAGGGATLEDPILHQRIETVPEPMDIYVMRAGERPKRLVSSSAHERCPAFSPDGERLAYLAVPGVPPGASWPTTGPPLDASLVVHRLDGATDLGERELEVRFPAAWGYSVRRGTGQACPQWSPNGDRLAFLAQTATSEVPQDLAELRVVTLNGQERVVNRGVPADEGSPFAWSPAGDALAFVRDDGVWTATLDGRPPRRVWEPDGRPLAVSWSARGELAVTVEAQVSDDGLGIHILDVDSGAASMVGTSFAAAAEWSPDGSRFAFLGRDGRIVVGDRDRGSTVALPPTRVDDHEVAVWYVAWSPDGEQLLVLALYTPVDTSKPQPNFASHPGLALLSVSTDGALIDVLTPWTWAFDWMSQSDVSWQPSRGQR